MWANVFFSGLVLPSRLVHLFTILAQSGWYSDMVTGINDVGSWYYAIELCIKWMAFGVPQYFKVPFLKHPSLIRLLKLCLTLCSAPFCYSCSSLVRFRHRLAGTGSSSWWPYVVWSTFSASVTARSVAWASRSDLSAVCMKAMH